MTSRIKNIVFGLGVSLVSIAVCLLVVETFLGVQYKRALEALESARGERELCTVSSEVPGLIYSGAPGKCERNSRGYRDYEYSAEKDKGVFRVVVIGDSVAAGYGVTLEDSFAKQLEAELNRVAQGERRAEVIGLAQHGYSTSQELLVLEHEALGYEPDVVIWSYVLNDPAHPYYHDANGELGQYHHEPRWHIVDFIARKLFLIREKLRWQDCERGEFHALLHCAYRDDIQQHIAYLGRLSAQARVPVVFMIHPVFGQGERFNDGYLLAPVHKELSGFASNAGLTVLDLADTYSPYDPADFALQESGVLDPWHPNARGHAVAASALFSALSELPAFQLWRAGPGD